MGIKRRELDLGKIPEMVGVFGNKLAEQQTFGMSFRLVDRAFILV